MFINKNSIKLLLVEDNPADARLVFEMLRHRINPSFKITHVLLVEEAVKKIQNEDFDVILLDLNLPDSRGFEGLERMAGLGLENPVIVLTGLVDEDAGLEALHKKASDYLTKGDLTTAALIRSIRYAIERKRTEQALSTERTNLQKIFDVVNIGMLLIDDSGIVKRINNIIAQWIDKDATAVSGSRPGNILGCIHVLDKDAVCGKTPHCSECAIRATFQVVLDSGKPIHGIEAQASLLMSGKEEGVWLDLSADPIIIDGKKCVILAVNNITERKKREVEFNRLNRTLKALSDNSHILMHSNGEKEYLEKVCEIIINDCSHQMVWIGFAEDNGSKNVKPVAQAGFDEGYLKTLNITWEDNERGRGPTGTAIRTGKPCLCEDMLTDPNFKPWREEALKRGYKSSLVLPLRTGGKILGAVNIYSDRPNAFSSDEVKLLSKLADDVAYGIMVMKLRRLEKEAEEILKRDKETFEALVKEKSSELISMHLQLERAKRLSDIGTLAATVAHELRNPLAAIIIATANIKRKAPDHLLEKHIASIEKKIKESDQIISNLLYYSRIKPPKYEKININHIIEECVELLSESSKSRKVSISLNIDPTKGRLINADPLQMKEVLSNILNNAVDAIPESSGGKIEMSAVNKNKSIELCISDNGTGIDNEHLAKIFEPFFTTKAKGTGLGLSVCKQIVELHDGTINIESEPGKGTTVKIALPAG